MDNAKPAIPGLLFKADTVQTAQVTSFQTARLTVRVLQVSAHNALSTLFYRTINASHALWLLLIALLAT